MRKCLVCDKDFNVTLLHPHQKYCSRKCCANAGHRRKRGLPVRNLELSCAVCEKGFLQKRANNIEYCSFDCKRLALSRKNQGIPIKGPKKHIKGSGYINNQGYKIFSRKHPNSSVRGQILEHVLIMSEFLKRPLRKGETVHHKNGIRDDNCLENLELWSSSHPPGQRVEDKIAWAIEFLKSYGYSIKEVT